MNAELNGKIVLVSGGAGGIGSAISKSFAKQGAKVIVHYHTSENEAKVLAKEIEGLAINADLTKSEDTTKLFNKIIEEEGRLDICIANAGNYPKESVPLWDIDDKRWNETISTNLSISSVSLL